MFVRRTWRCPASLAILLLAACDVKVSPEETLVSRYAEGIQSRHEPTYRDYYLLCHPDQGGKTLSSRLAEYEVLRRTGSVTFSPDGIEFVKLSGLGRAVFFRLKEPGVSGEVLTFRTQVVPEYQSINFNEYPSGAILYMLGQPFGSVVALKPGRSDGPPRTVLKGVELEWAWTRRPDSPRGWCLLSVLPKSDTATFETLRFREAEPANGADLAATP